MKILNERDSFLSNYEVAEHLKDIKKKYNWTFTKEDEEEHNNDKRKNRKRFAACGLNLEVITRDILAYVANSSTAVIDSPAKFQELMVFLNGFDLMKVEKLQIVNSLPRSMVTLYALVEECDQRFDEERSQSIIDKINELFPVEEEEEEEEEEEAGEAEEHANDENTAMEE
ncbi:putative DNA-directed RNA polymerase III subunit [Scheffersomyces xylosifermentans]|uniref:putative DNA-directed RNA polymerase III subunit n=1 Tax=Scheffersomyces xylosifermentans TaxID=1304137 RepID=UPI00315C6897